MNIKEILFERSFASHTKSKFWSENNELKPNQVFKNTHKKYWFDCDKCIHHFKISLHSINIKNNWCIFCANQKLCEKEECKECFEKSFASHHKSKFWSQLNELKPHQI